MKIVWKIEELSNLLVSEKNLEMHETDLGYYVEIKGLFNFLDAKIGNDALGQYYYFTEYEHTFDLKFYTTDDLVTSISHFRKNTILWMIRVSDYDKIKQTPNIALNVDHQHYD